MLSSASWSWSKSVCATTSLNATASCFSGDKGLWEERKKVWIELGKEYYGSFLPNLGKSTCRMLLGGQVIWAQLTRCSLALCVPSLPSAGVPVTTFAGLADQTSPGELSAPPLPGFVPGPVSCTHRLLQREISSGSGCELYVGSLCSQSNLLQKIGGGLFFFSPLNSVRVC